MQVTVDEDALDRVAALPVVREPTREALAEGQRDVGITADQVGRITAQLEQDRAQAGGGPDLTSRCCPPREADQVDPGVAEQGRSRLPAPGNHVDRAGREARLGEDLGEAQRGRGRLRSGLDHLSLIHI